MACPHCHGRGYIVFSCGTPWRCTCDDGRKPMPLGRIADRYRPSAAVAIARAKRHFTIQDLTR